MVSIHRVVVAHGNTLWNFALEDNTFASLRVAFARTDEFGRTAKAASRGALWQVHAARSQLEISRLSYSAKRERSQDLQAAVWGAGLPSIIFFSPVTRGPPPVSISLFALIRPNRQRARAFIRRPRSYSGAQRPVIKSRGGLVASALPSARDALRPHLYD
jgi:hypothetical protein